MPDACYDGRGLLVPQSRLGLKLLGIRLRVSPNGSAVLKGLYNPILSEISFLFLFFKKQKLKFCTESHGSLPSAYVVGVRVSPKSVFFFGRGIMELVKW